MTWPQAAYLPRRPQGAKGLSTAELAAGQGEFQTTKMQENRFTTEHKEVTEKREERELGFCSVISMVGCKI